MLRRTAVGRSSRQEREARGRAAENLAAAWLRLRGYRIVERRLRTPLGEIDIVAARGKVLAMVEVKARGSHATGMEALTATQRHRIERAAAWFLAQAPSAAVRRTVRFDLIVVRPMRLPVHIANAWTPENAQF